MSEVAASVPRISASAAQASIARGAVVIDIRFPFDYAGGRIPGALNMPGTSFLSRHDAAPKNRPLVFVCADGQESPEVAASAVDAGFADVAVLDGGFDSWYEQDLPTETISDGVSSMPAPPPPPPSGKPSIESTTVGDLLADPKSKAILEQNWPKLADAPMALISGQTLRAVSGFPPAGLDEAKLKAIQTALDAAF